MARLYQDAPSLAKPAFAISNALLFFAGLGCFFYWVKPAKKNAQLVVWIWIVVEAINVLAHILWASIAGAYNPGLATAVLFVPVLAYLSYSMSRSN